MTAREIVTAVRESGGWFDVIHDRLVVRSRRPLSPLLVSLITENEDEIKPLVRRPQIARRRR